MRVRPHTFARPLFTLGVALGLTLVMSPGCGDSGSSGDNNTKGDGSVDDLFGKDGGPKGPCQGLECAVASCGGQPESTTITGTVFAPNGTLPLYNVVVFVPNAPLDPIPEGASCDRCGNVSGNPVTATITDTQGRFTLTGVPTGKDIPLVIQVGKWRREIKVPDVKSCTANPIADKTLTRLPKNKGEGHIPKIAVTTGNCDHLACLLPKLGLDASEYTTAGGDGRLNLYKGATHQFTNDQGQPVGSPEPAPAPSGTPPATDLWNAVDTLKKYDIVMLSCECDEHNETKLDPAKQALYDYAKLGGRIFSSHYHYTWFQNSPVQEMRDIAQWRGDGQLANSGGLQSPFFVDESFPKGKALAEWLVNVAASSTRGRIPINQPRADVAGVKAGAATRWVYNKPSNRPETTKYLSFNTPIGVAAEEQCGKVVFGDMHITGGNTTTLPDQGFPQSCPPELTPEEKALIFLFFDLSSCVQDEAKPPAVPVK